jgi:hypothetical protein
MEEKYEEPWCRDDLFDEINDVMNNLLCSSSAIINDIDNSILTNADASDIIKNDLAIDMLSLECLMGELEEPEKDILIIWRKDRDYLVKVLTKLEPVNEVTSSLLGFCVNLCEMYFDFHFQCLKYFSCIC